mmetsp:Transcript_25678/g.80377  ORF Transcript_25678/g.80377 Transcript_25678/m.80377 type:complete len:285 (+) Transcript_25678:707-1561(+)
MHRGEQRLWLPRRLRGGRPRHGIHIAVLLEVHGKVPHVLQLAQHFADGGAGTHDSITHAAVVWKAHGDAGDVVPLENARLHGRHGDLAARVDAHVRDGLRHDFQGLCLDDAAVLHEILHEDGETVVHLRAANVHALSPLHHRIANVGHHARTRVHLDVCNLQPGACIVIVRLEQRQAFLAKLGHQRQVAHIQCGHAGLVVGPVDAQNPLFHQDVGRDELGERYDEVLLVVDVVRPHGKPHLRGREDALAATLGGKQRRDVSVRPENGHLQEHGDLPLLPTHEPR